MDEEYKFLGCDIIPLKVVDVPRDANNLKVVISTCFFMNSIFDINEKTFTYLNELINNVEVFQAKIDKFITPVYQDKTYSWVYRIYIDSTILDDIEKLFSELPSDENRDKIDNKNNYSSIVRLTRNKDVIDFISKFMKKYIERIMTLGMDKYKNIEIFKYNNSSVRKRFSGHSATFGTLLRFHPLVDMDVDVCIMRNCSNSLAPLDLLIQEFWIKHKINEKKNMTYFDGDYTFSFYRNKDYLQKSRDLFWADRAVGGVEQRFFGGLTSCRTFASDKKNYRDFFTDIYSKITDYKEKELRAKGINIRKNNSKIFEYGIDELILDNFVKNILELDVECFNKSEYNALPTMKNGNFTRKTKKDYLFDKFQCNSFIVNIYRNNDRLYFEKPFEINQKDLAGISNLSDKLKNISTLDYTDNPFEKIKFEIIIKSKEYIESLKEFMEKGIIGSVEKQYDTIFTFISAYNISQYVNLHNIHDITLLLKSIDFIYNPVILYKYNTIYGEQYSMSLANVGLINILSSEEDNTLQVHLVNPELDNNDDNVDQLLEFIEGIYIPDNINPICFYPDKMYVYEWKYKKEVKLNFKLNDDNKDKPYLEISEESIQIKSGGSIYKKNITKRKLKSNKTKTRRA